MILNKRNTNRIFERQQLQKVPEVIDLSSECDEDENVAVKIGESSTHLFPELKNITCYTTKLESWNLNLIYFIKSH